MASVLEELIPEVRKNDRSRGLDVAGRERYFLARAWLALGQKSRALAELTTLVEELPLAYYTLHAYSRLHHETPEAARNVLTRAWAASDAAAAPAAPTPTTALPAAFVRIVELLRQEENAAARRELDMLAASEKRDRPKVLIALAHYFEQLGSVDYSHRLIRSYVKAWRDQWPIGSWLRSWRLAYPRPHHDIVQQAAPKNQIAEALVYAIIREESAFQASVVSPAQAYGLMQLILPTARRAGRPLGLSVSPKTLKHPETNILLGTQVLGGLTERFSDQPILAIPGYNAGPGRPIRWIKEFPMSDLDLWVEHIPYRETRRYTRRVLASRAAYAFLYPPSRLSGDELARWREKALLLPLSL